MSQTVQQALQAASLYSDERDYLLVKLPPPAIMAAAGIVAEIGEAFCALVIDKDEVSLVIPAEALDNFAPRMPGYTLADSLYRLITIDVVLEPTLIGFMATMSRALADAGVSIIPLGAFSRDHLLVPSAQFEVAIDALKRLQSS